MHSCICLRVLMHIFTCTHAFVCAHSCIYYICSHAPMHYYSHAFMSLFARTHAYIQTYSSCIFFQALMHLLYVYICTCIHTYSHALMYLLARTHAYIQTYSCIFAKAHAFIIYIYSHASIHISMHNIQMHKYYIFTCIHTYSHALMYCRFSVYIYIIPSVLASSLSRIQEFEL